MKFSEPQKKHMQQFEQEKFGVKVQSHDTIFCLVFLFNMLFVRHFNIGWFPISIWQFEKNCIVRTVKEIKSWESNLKVGIFGHLTIQLTCATDAESLGNQTVNQNVWPHSSYHDSELKSQWKSIKVYENEWNHNTKYSYKMQCH